MSIMCCIYVPEGIVLAADSRLTRKKLTGKPTVIPPDKDAIAQIIHHETAYTSSDNAQKVLLIKKASVGISFCGDALIAGSTIADFIRKFEIDCVSVGDTTEKIACRLSTYYNGLGTCFFVVGYDNDVPYVYEVSRRMVLRHNIAGQKQVVLSPKDIAADEKSENVYDIEIGIPENLKTTPDDIKNQGSEITNPIVIYGAIWAGQMTAITKIVNNPPILNADWATMPLKDAIDFAELLVDTTIKYERFCDDIQTCGGDIDILVITKDESFWKQHKIYNPIRRSL